jgi:hypothetical protein
VLGSFSKELKIDGWRNDNNMEIDNKDLSPVGGQSRISIDELWFLAIGIARRIILFLTIKVRRRQMHRFVRGSGCLNSNVYVLTLD